ncbi:MAG: hypothetical protein IJ583_06155, partial [Firmicutes bacterium]|nr:hypothetical protein [Bacillota bacterium]
TVDEAEKLLKDLGFGYVVQDDSEKEEVKEEEESSEIVDTEKNDDDKEKIQTNSDSKTIHEQTPQAGVELESGTVIKLKIK